MADKKAEKKPVKDVKDEAKAGNRDEQVGFHKGSLSTLAKERQELARILQIVEQLMQLHIAALKELGVDLEKDMKEAIENVNQAKKPEKPIEDML